MMCTEWPSSDFDWIEGLLLGEVELVLPRIEIPLADASAIIGRGRVLWKGGDYPQLSAITDRLPESKGWDPGQKIIGQTADGSSLEIKGIRDGWCQTSSGACTDWELPCERITVRRQLTEFGPELRPQTCQLSGVFDPWPLSVAGRCSTFTDSNPAFGKTHETLDWGEVVANGVRLAFREVGRVCRFRIRAASPSSCWSSFDAIHAALSFLFGCRVRLRGWQFSSQVDMENVLLGNRPTAMRRVYPPLDNFLWQRRGDLTGFEKPLALAWAFFLTPIGQTIRPLLYLVWDSADLALESRLLNSATALEGMVRALERDHGTPLPYADKVIAYLEGLNIAAADLARWRGLVGGTGQLHVPTVLRRWVSEGRYQAREEELKAFSRQRHPLAHGSMLNDAGDGAAKQDLALLMNLINKVLLSEMDYRGPFADYGGNRDYSQSCAVLI